MDEKDYYSCEELIELYQSVGQADAAALNAAARERFHRPNAPEIRVETGLHGRWFPLDDEENYGPPKYTIKGGRCCWVGIMEDGRAFSY